MTTTPPTLQRGAALLTAMLTVTLVATFAAAALWQQWRNVEIESAERNRTQMQWVLNGALDWARLILQEDARNGEVDHLSEPWSLPLQEARLSSFLALDKSNTDDAVDAFLSGRISDQQALLNVRNLVQDGKTSQAHFQAFTRLFRMLGLPQAQLRMLVDKLIASDAASKEPATASAPAAGASAQVAAEKAIDTNTAPLKPYRMEQLAWLGLPQTTVRALMPFATLLPTATPLNLNTASAEVLAAALPGFDLPRAQQLVNERARSHFKNTVDAFKSAGVQEGAATLVEAKDYSVGSRYFAVRGRLRLGDSAVQEVSLVERNGSAVRVVWRQREVLDSVATASLQ